MDPTEQLSSLFEPQRWEAERSDGGGGSGGYDGNGGGKRDCGSGAGDDVLQKLPSLSCLIKDQLRQALLLCLPMSDPPIVGLAEGVLITEAQADVTSLEGFGQQEDLPCLPRPGCPKTCT